MFISVRFINGTQINTDLRAQINADNYNMNMESILESLIFVSGEPVGFKKLEKIIGKDKEELKLTAGVLAKKYEEEKRGLRILIKDNQVQMVTAKENSEYLDKFLQGDLQDNLSQAALEVLSIVAYRGPISRAGIEEIRGVNCSFTLRQLLIRGLMERVNNPSDARAYLYQISFDFLKKLGVKNVRELPDFEELNKKEKLEIGN